MGQQIHRMGLVHILEYYSARRKREAVTLATTWRNPGDVVLSE